MTSAPAPEDVAALIERCNLHLAYERRIAEAWRAGFRAGELAHADDYERGVYDGAIARKRAERELVSMVRLQVVRYGPRSRQVTDPVPEDFPGMLRGHSRQDGAA